MPQTTNIKSNFDLLQFYSPLSNKSRGHGSTGATGSWAPAEISNRCLAPVLRKSWVLRDPISSKSVYISQKSYQIPHTFHILLKNAGKSRNWPPVLRKPWTGPCFGAQWHHSILILFYSSLKMSLLLHKAALSLDFIKLFAPSQMHHQLGHEC